MVGNGGTASAAVGQVHKPTMGGAVVLIVVAFLFYHFVIAKK
jgi:hypothetical protein